MATLRRRRKKCSFKCIEDCKDYEELKKVSVIPSHKQLLEESIFEAVSLYFKQLKNDIVSLYGVVERDIAIENQQIGLVELQLKNSLKRVNHAYNSILIERDQNKNAKYSSRMWQSFVDREDQVQRSIDEIEKSIGDIMNNIVAVDLRFPKKSQVLNEDIFNRQHYPIMFQLVNERFQRNPSPPPEEEAPVENCDEIEAPASNGGGGQFMPPTLRKTCPPSTSTTLENINASDIINIKRL